MRAVADALALTRREPGNDGSMEPERDRYEPELPGQADDEPPLTRREADVAGITPTPETVYGEDSYFPNEEDQRDAHHAEAGEHF